MPSAEFRIKAFPPNYEIQFNFWSKVQNAGVSNIMPASGKVVHGALFEVPERELQELDVKEGVYIGDYDCQNITAMGEDGAWHEADLYRVIDPQGPFKLAKNNVKGMLEGTREPDLDPGYVRTIEEFYAQSN